MVSTIDQEPTSTCHTCPRDHLYEACAYNLIERVRQVHAEKQSYRPEYEKSHGRSKGSHQGISALAGIDRTPRWEVASPQSFSGENKKDGG